MPRSFSGAVVAVVGASGGLGAPIARELSGRWAQVILAGPHVERLTALGIDGAVVIELDVRDPGAGDALAAVAMERFGRLDGLTNAAGVVAFGSPVDTDDTVIEELFLTNVMGPLWLIKRIVPLLAESRGFVVNLRAVVAEQPMANMAAYSATRAALRRCSGVRRATTAHRDRAGSATTRRSCARIGAGTLTRRRRNTGHRRDPDGTCSIWRTPKLDLASEQAIVIFRSSGPVQVLIRSPYCQDPT